MTSEAISMDRKEARASVLANLGGGPIILTANGRERAGVEPVTYSEELQRIQAIPVREEDDAYRAALQSIEALVRRPQGTMRLRPAQIRSLAEAKLAGGLFAPIVVGGGKSLLSCLLPTVLARPMVGGSCGTVILTQAGLIKQAREMAKDYSEHFFIRNDIRWLSYGILSSPKQYAILERLAPHTIVADEAHILSNGRSARGLRFQRYMRDHPDTLFVAMSGTVTKRSIKDYSHLLALALGDRTPLPRAWRFLSEWAEAVDVSDRPRPIGALTELLTDEHIAEYLGNTHVEAVKVGRRYLRQAGQRQFEAESAESAGLQNVGRDAIRRRMVSTVGVVATTTNELPNRLVLALREGPKCNAIREAHKEMLRTWSRPDGEQLVFGLEIARISRHMRLGGYMRWVWPATVSEDAKGAWLAARSAFRSELRAFLKDHAAVGLDSPHLVEGAIKRGEIHFDGWEDWLREERAMRPLLGAPTPQTEWVEISRAVIDDAAAWAKSNLGLVWTDAVFVGKAIAKAAGCPYYGAGPEAANEILKERGTRTIVCSIKSHGTGRNLQMYNRALVAGGPSSGSIWEQLLGRLDRPGQTADEVRFDFYRAFLSELEQSCNDARYIGLITGSSQKLDTAIREGW